MKTNFGILHLFYHFKNSKVITFCRNETVHVYFFNSQLIKIGIVIHNNFTLLARVQYTQIKNNSRIN